jgi:drug/metabolite transporter (DMT)-like permease
MGPEVLAITYGISSAIFWGTGDFSAGFASKKSGVLSVILFSQLIGAVFLICVALYISEPFPPIRHMITGALAGFVGLLGLIALYVGLSRGRMGIVAPLSAVVTALIPIGVSFVKEGLPETGQILGLTLALFSVWLLSFVRDEKKTIRFSEFILPLLAGLGFGLFFVLIDSAIQESVLWPLVGSRSLSILLVFTLFIIKSNTRIPSKNQFPIIALAGIFDVLGNLFFALATHIGRLDISATLSSLFPATTVALAWFFLKEHLKPQQWAGVLVALISLVLIAG